MNVLGKVVSNDLDRWFRVMVFVVISLCSVLRGILQCF